MIKLSVFVYCSLHSHTNTYLSSVTDSLSTVFSAVSVYVVSTQAVGLTVFHQVCVSVNIMEKILKVSTSIIFIPTLPFLEDIMYICELHA